MFGTTSQTPIFRPTITEPQDFHQIDPMQNQVCRVCDEPAAGFHFGAFTCEGCKSFFGRSSNNQASIQDCKNNYRCVINKKNRTSCKACRLRKCLMVGMSKSGSRYGRRSNWFKIHCLMQQATSSRSGMSHQQGPYDSSRSSSSTTSSLQMNKSLKREGPLRSISPTPKRTNSLWRPIDPAGPTPPKSSSVSIASPKQRVASPEFQDHSTMSIVKPQPGYGVAFQPQDPKQPPNVSNFDDPTLRTAANVSLLYSAAIGSNMPGFMPPLLNYHAALTQLPLYRQMLLTSIIASTRKAYADSVQNDRNAVNLEILRTPEAPPRIISDSGDPTVDILSDDDDVDDDSSDHDKQELLRKFKNSEPDSQEPKVSPNQMSVV